MGMFDLFTQAFTGLNLGDGVNFSVLGILVGLIVTIMITRSIHKIRIAFFPVLVMLERIGVPVGILPISIAGIIFVVTIFNLRDIGTVITGTVERVTGAWQAGTSFVSEAGLSDRANEQLRRENRMFADTAASRSVGRLAKQREKLEDATLLANERLQHELQRLRQTGATRSQIDLVKSDYNRWLKEANAQANMDSAIRIWDATSIRRSQFDLKKSRYANWLKRASMPDTPTAIRQKLEDIQREKDILLGTATSRSERDLIKKRYNDWMKRAGRPSIKTAIQNRIEDIQRQRDIFLGSVSSKSEKDLINKRYQNWLRDAKATLSNATPKRATNILGRSPFSEHGSRMRTRWKP